MSIELKIKSKHLGEESRIIKFEERALKKKARAARNRQQQRSADIANHRRESLRNHRRWDVRNENRATFLARAYLDGKPYESVEASRREEWKFQHIILPRVLKMVNKYGEEKVEDHQLCDWARLQERPTNRS